MKYSLRVRFYLRVIQPLCWLLLAVAGVVWPSDAAAQAPSPWARAISASGADVSGNYITTDPAGNIYLAGSFQTTITIGTTSFTASGTDSFLAKLDAQGNVLWARQLGGASVQNVSALATDASGNVFVGGGFTTTLVLGTTTLSLPGSAGYLAKYNAQGQDQWARVISTGPATSAVTAIHADAAGALRLVGAYFQSVTVGTVALANGSSRLSAANTFVAGCSPAGVVQWASAITSPEDIYGTDATLDGAGNLIITGSLTGTARFGPLFVRGLNPDAGSVYVAKYNAQGTVQWVRQAGRTAFAGDAAGRAVAADAAGNVYVSGNSAGPAQFGALSHPDPQMFVAKMDPQGNFVWVVGDPVADYADGADLALHPNGSIYVVGTYRYYMAAGPHVMQNGGSNDVFLARYSSATGAGLELSGGNSGGPDFGQHLAIDGYGNVHFTGQYRAGTGGAFAIRTHTLPGGPYYRTFIAREGAVCPPTAAPVIAGPASVCAGDTLTLTATTAASPTLYQWSGPNGFVADQATVRIPNAAAGNYQVTINAGGCPATSAPLAVAVVPGPPTPTVSAQYSGTTVTFTSSSPAGNQWYVNGTSVPGATAATYVVSSAASPATYTVVVTNAAGCRSAPSAPQVVTATRAATASMGLAVYPNPAADGQVQVSWRPTARPTRLRLVNSLGQLVRNHAVQPGAQAQSLELTGLSAGVYIVQLEGPTAIETRRLLRN